MILVMLKVDYQAKKKDTGEIYMVINGDPDKSSFLVLNATAIDRNGSQSFL